MRIDKTTFAPWTGNEPEMVYLVGASWVTIKGKCKLASTEDVQKNLLEQVKQGNLRLLVKSSEPDKEEDRLVEVSKPADLKVRHENDDQKRLDAFVQRAAETYLSAWEPGQLVCITLDLDQPGLYFELQPTQPVDESAETED